MEQESKTLVSELSPAQRKVLFLMENLRPFEKIEIKRAEDGRVSIISTHTTKEDYPMP